MRVVRVHEYGSPDVLSYEAIDDPEPAAGQIKIQVLAASVNYADLMRRSNTPYPFPTPLPFIPGGEVAGLVVGHGSGVSEPPVGTRVFALVGRDGSGGYAEYAIADAHQVIPIPAGLSEEQACAIIVAGLTALLMLQDVAKLQPGERVLVPGAGGGVGAYAIQLAKYLGAGMVIGAASTPAKRSAAMASGADGVVDYTDPQWATQVRELTGGHGVDIALEMSGDPIFSQTIASMAPFGRMVVYGMASRKPLRLTAEDTLHLFYQPALNQQIISFNLGLWFGLRPTESIAALQQLIGLAAQGIIQIPVSQVFPLAQAAEAHRLIEARQTTGKIILKP